MEMSCATLVTDGLLYYLRLWVPINQYGFVIFRPSVRPLLVHFSIQPVEVESQPNIINPDDMSYTLSQVLQAHDADVKCVIAVNTNTLFSASRDRTVAQWSRESQVGEYSFLCVFMQLNIYANPEQPVQSATDFIRPSRLCQLARGDTP
jgi:hypothetical protein